MGKVKTSRKFGSKRYKWQSAWVKKSKAKAKKNTLKKQGKRVRIVKHKDAYDVYVR